MTVKFKEGQTYHARHIGDRDLTTSFTITKRREKTIWGYEGIGIDVIARRIYVHEGVEKAKIDEGITIKADVLESPKNMEKHSFVMMMQLSAPEIEKMLINPDIDGDTKKFLGRVLVNITGF